MSEELQDNPKKTSKEIWLFLIFVDIVALCVFGYFIYKSFFNEFDFSSLIQQYTAETVVSSGKDASAEAIVAEEIILPKESEPAKAASKAEAGQPKQSADQPAQAAQAEVKTETKTEEKAEVKTDTDTAVKTEVKTEQPAQVAQTEVKTEAKAAPKKQSVFVSGTGKTRKVTFKYYGDAKRVSIVSGFTMRKPEALKKVGGVWSITLVIYPGTYKYIYIVDGKEVLDPNAESDGGRSIVTIK